LFPSTPVHTVMGGLHLGGVMERNIPDSVDGLRTFNIANIITGHCTGWRALHALATALGDTVSQSAVGTTYTFSAGPPRKNTTTPPNSPPPPSPPPPPPPTPP